MLTKNASGFRESRATGGSDKKLDAEFIFKPGETPADDRFGESETKGSGRNASGIGNLHECLQLLNVQIRVPRLATQNSINGYYRIASGNENVYPPIADFFK